MGRYLSSGGLEGASIAGSALAMRRKHALGVPLSRAESEHDATHYHSEMVVGISSTGR